MTMSELLPIFKQFLESEILTKHFDYLVPIESKGALVLEKILSQLDIKQPTVLYRRAFDFIETEELYGKTAALIDDAVFTGKTINNSAERLAKKGLADIQKYAFILYQSEEIQNERDIEGIKPSVILRRTEFDNLLEDLSQLSLQSRPSNPDHMIFSIPVLTEHMAEILFDASLSTGYVAEYKRNPSVRMWSVHYPDWSPLIDNAYAADTCSNKLRVFVDDRRGIVKFSAQFFPSLYINQNLCVMDDILWGKCHTLLSMHSNNQTIELKTRDLYESFTIATRLKQGKNFLSEISKTGIPTKNTSLETSRLKQYYSDGIAQELAVIWMDYTKDLHSEPAQLSCKNFCEETDYPEDIMALAKDLMTILDLDYKKENRQKQSRYEWESVGRDISELAQETRRPKLQTAIGIEILGDYGYCVPMFDMRKVNGVQQAKRSYRLAETGTARLNIYENS